MRLASYALSWFLWTLLVVFLYWVHTLGWWGVVAASIVVSLLLATCSTILMETVETLALITKIMGAEEEDDSEGG